MQFHYKFRPLWQQVLILFSKCDFTTSLVVDGCGGGGGSGGGCFPRYEGR